MRDDDDDASEKDDEDENESKKNENEDNEMLTEEQKQKNKIKDKYQKLSEHIREVAEFLLEVGYDINQVSNNGMTSMMIAI